ncbi:hypothetical protein [Streptomyces sp. NPDC005507]|uniref:hypothetical protein n=1 Tax=Streptomyces sp. NPDC005507 TaxID=3154885 RepID=UPI0033A0459A
MTQPRSIRVPWRAVNHPTHPRSDALSDELAAGAKAVVLHFAQAAQTQVQR